MNVLDRQPIRLAADVGGTFTDVAAFDETSGELRLGKTLTTPSRLVDGIENGVGKADAAFRASRLFLHGTTVAINTILERTGARCALLTTQGFRDIYEIGRVNRPESYNLFFKRHEPLIDRDLRFEIRERMDAQGTVLIPLDEARGARRGRAGGGAGRAGDRHPVPAFVPQSGARAARQGDRRARCIPSCSSPRRTNCRQEYREFERTSTAAANAYVGPRVRRYLGEMGEHLDAAGFAGEFLIVQSTGGLFSIERGAVRLHPDAGVRPGRRRDRHQGAVRQHRAQERHRVRHGRHHRQGRRDLQRRRADDRQRADRRLRHRPAGADPDDRHPGGRHRRRLASRASRSARLHVGPESAGAQPGPVCYGQGGEEPTITDANLILGRLGADRFLGGEMRLDLEAAKRALDIKVAKPLGLDLMQAADGILRIATTKMSHMVRWVTTERGLDAADFTLVAYGGAGPLHAAMVARELRIAKVVIPRAPGHFSAYGMLVADLRRDFVNTWFNPLADVSFAAMEEIYADMETARPPGHRATAGSRSRA